MLDSRNVIDNNLTPVRVGLAVVAFGRFFASLLIAFFSSGRLGDLR
jgi:hypothetical protein